MFEQIKDRIKDLSEEERRKSYEASFSFLSSEALQYSEFINIIQQIPQRDEIKIFLSMENEEYLILDRGSSEEKYRNFIEETLENENISVKVEIDKQISGGRFSVYYFEKFVQDIVSLSIEEVLKVFSMFFNETDDYIIFELFDNTNIFYTKTMFFLPIGNNEILCSFDRTQRLMECRETSYFYNQEAYELLPDDFRIEVGYEGNPLKILFLKLETVLAASLLASNSMIQEGKMKLQIMGQRSVEYTCRLNEVCGNPMLYIIYNWIYSGGNSMDKAIIARNIICLHCKYESMLNLDEKVLASIQSNYNLYLKDNVTQYLELKNKVAEFISDIVSRTGEYATELLDKFKNNIIAIFGFLFTVIIANIVSAQPLDNIFTKDITIILELVLVGSVVYLFICYKQSKYQMQKVYDSYENLKKMYKGILIEDDIRECFQNDQILLEMKETVEKSEKRFLFIWIAFLIILLVIVESISEAPTVWTFIQNIIHISLTYINNFISSQK